MAATCKVTISGRGSLNEHVVKLKFKENSTASMRKRISIPGTSEFYCQIDFQNLNNGTMLSCVSSKGVKDFLVSSDRSTKKEKNPFNILSFNFKNETFGTMIKSECW